LARLTVTSTAFISASTRWTPATSSKRLPTSNALRAADVTSMPSTYRVWPFWTPSVCTVSIGGARRLV
jgi:hypothetical protein